jgi:hypothetical protein
VRLDTADACLGMGLTRQLGSQHKRDAAEADDRLQHSNSQEHCRAAGAVERSPRQCRGILQWPIDLNPCQTSLDFYLFLVSGVTQP